jgi:hypothetical protein
MNKSKAYGYELLIAVEAATIAEVENVTNMEMTKIIRWSKDIKIQFNDKKSHAMLISRRCRERKFIGIYLNHNRLKQLDKLKYLGIIINRKFKFTRHTKYATDRCTKLINALSKSARISWGLGHEALEKTYNVAVLSQLVYAATAWIESMKKKYNRGKYIRVQRLITLRKSKHTARFHTAHSAVCQGYLQ